MIRFLILLVLLFCSFLVYTEEIRKLKVQHVKRTYFVSMEFSVKATIENVRRVITDYQNLSDLDPSINKVEILESTDDDIDRVRTHIHECILLFCKNIIRTEDIRIDEKGNLYAQIVKEMSDMKSGESRWEFRESDDKVEIKFNSVLEPDFWIPPLIGTGIFKANLRDHLRLTASNLEELSN